MSGQSQPPQAADGLWVLETVWCCSQYSPCEHTHLIPLTQQHGDIPFSISKHLLPLPHLETRRIWKIKKCGIILLLCKSQEDMLLDICLMLSSLPQWAPQAFPKVVGKGFPPSWVVHRGEDSLVPRPRVQGSDGNGMEEGRQHLETQQCYFLSDSAFHPQRNDFLLVSMRHVPI